MSQDNRLSRDLVVHDDEGHHVSAFVPTGAYVHLAVVKGKRAHTVLLDADAARKLGRFLLDHFGDDDADPEGEQ